MKSIKKFFIRATKKGKTRGRPSREERLMSAIASEAHRKNEDLFHKKMMDVILYGTCSINESELKF